MREYFFAGVRLLIEDYPLPNDIDEMILPFANVQPYTDTFILRFGLDNEFGDMASKARDGEIVFDAETSTIKRMSEGWFFEMLPEHYVKSYMIATKDYSEMLCVPRNGYIPFSSIIRINCETGITSKGGLSLHASLIDFNSEGVLFLGPSGMGKSTQAKLWEKYEGADMVIGDRPTVRIIDGVWYAYGMPWDGKDSIRKQKRVPIKAIVRLQQAKCNNLTALTKTEALKTLLTQTLLPMWDDVVAARAYETMANLSVSIPFYSLENMADLDAVNLLKDELFAL